VLAAPLTPATRGLVDAAVLSAMKPDAHLVNVGRGAIVDESALVSALIEGRIGGATLDVFDIEPLPIGHPLWEAPNVTITAHMSGDVVGWRDTLAAQYTENVRRWLVGQPLRNVVDKKLGYIPGPGR
jgi:phosphoglycerate dehydrogenase-like enzyme